jgi:hypothetical protein
MFFCVSFCFARYSCDVLLCRYLSRNTKITIRLNFIPTVHRWLFSLLWLFNAVSKLHDADYQVRKAQRHVMLFRVAPERIQYYAHCAM